MPKKRLTRAERQALTRTEVLDAAARVFPKRGYHQTSLDEVAEQAGLTIGAVYSNFESKADLFLALYEQQVTRWTEELEARVLEGTTPAERTRAAGVWWARVVEGDRDWMVLEIEFWAHAVRDPELRRRFAGLFAPLRQKTGELIERASRDFDIPLPAPAQQLATAITALCTGLVVERLLLERGDPAEDLGAALEALLGSPSGGADQAG